jgi:spore coat polysaccharide biosynthesis protein SpsF
VRRVAVIQARTGSTRLPSKVLADLCGAPLLAREIERVRRARLVDDIVVATTTSSADDAVVALADQLGARWYRGSELDVLSRMNGAAREASAELVIRISGDCPLVDPSVIDRVVATLERRGKELDYVTTEPPSTFPKGLDTEALYADVLERVARMATSRSAREHVTFFIYGESPSLFRAESISDAQDNSDQRWTVDTPSDLALVRRLYEDLDLANGGAGHSYRDIVAYVRANPSVRAINAHETQRDPRTEA